MRALLILVPVGDGHYVLLPLELFTNAVAVTGRPARAFFTPVPGMSAVVIFTTADTLSDLHANADISL